MGIATMWLFKFSDDLRDTKINDTFHCKFYSRDTGYIAEAQKILLMINNVTIRLNTIDKKLKVLIFKILKNKSISFLLFLLPS